MDTDRLQEKSSFMGNHASISRKERVTLAFFQQGSAE
jgi:hypothetical protein